MSLWTSYRSLSPTARIGLGVGVIAWGVVGLYLSDRAEERFGFIPTEKDKAELDRLTPKIQLVDRDARR